MRTTLRLPGGSASAVAALVYMACAPPEAAGGPDASTQLDATTDGGSDETADVTQPEANAESGGPDAASDGGSSDSPTDATALDGMTDAAPDGMPMLVCDSGAVPPEASVLAISDAGLGGIVTDGTNVYGATNQVPGGGIASVAIDGGGITNLFPTPAYAGSGVWSLAVNAPNVYWLSNVALALYCTLWAVPIEGGYATQVGGSNFGATDHCIPISLAIDGTYAYWTMEGAQSVVARCPLDGGTCTAPAAGTATGGNLNYGGGIAVNSTTVYFGADGTLNSVPLDGGTVTTLVPGLPTTPRWVGVDSMYVYYLPSSSETVPYGTPSPGPVMRVPLDGGTSELVVSIPTLQSNVLIDATSLYWIDAAGVQKAPLAGGCPTLLAGPTAANSIAIDATNIYFTDGTTLYQAAK